MSYGCPLKPPLPPPSASCCNMPVTCVISPPKRTCNRIREPTPEPIVKRCVKRNPTPPCDIIERVLVKKHPQTIIENIIEQPRKPPPKIIERIEYEPCPPPIIRNSCIFVDPTPRPCPASCPPQCAQQCPPQCPISSCPSRVSCVAQSCCPVNPPCRYPKC